MDEKTLHKMIRVIKLILFLAGVFAMAAWHKYLKESFWLLKNENHPVNIILMYAFMLFVSILLPNLILTVVGYAAAAKQKRKKERELLKLQSQIQDKSKVFGAEELIKLFENVKVEKPRLKGLMEEAIKQFEIFYDDKETINVVMNLQEIKYEVIENGIRQSEEKLLRTMKSILVDVSVWNPKQLEDEARKKSFDIIYQEIEAKLKTSKKNLDYFHQLLMRVKDINEDEISEDQNIKLLIEALDKD